MRKYINTSILSIPCLFILLGCGVTITPETATYALDGAHLAVEDARAYRADIHAESDLRKAEKLLNEAEKALSQNRHQRAYTLAVKAEKKANEALARAEKSSGAPPEEAMPEEPWPQGEPEEITMRVRPVEKPSVMPPTQAEQKNEGRVPYGPPMPSDAIVPVAPGQMQPERMPFRPSPQEAAMAPDMQSRMQAAARALDEAQRAVSAARLLVSKTQAEIGLYAAEANIQKVRNSGAPQEIINMLQSLYDQARKALAEGDYERAARLVEGAQSYSQAFGEAIR